MIVAGIDEAGYGPTLGPYVAGLAALRLPGDLDRIGRGGSPDLYQLLEPAVARRGGRGGRITVSDSKALHSQGAGVRRLEEAALSFLLAAGRVLPAGLDPAIDQLAPEDAGVLQQAPWHQPGSGDAALPLPRAASGDRVEELAAGLAAAMRSSGVELIELTARITGAREWNLDLTRTQNKSTTAFGRVRQHLDHLWRAHAAEGVLVVVDKQGGRNAYAGPLSEVFPALSLETLCEGAELSSYRAVHGERRMLVSFAPRADDTELPVALASILAKYLRELLMEQMNSWFTARQPGLEPTAGYPVDARRWLAETESLRRELGIRDDELVRAR